MKIKNIIFDVGNVMVRWAPHEIISSILPQMDSVAFFNKMYPLWIELNLGKLSEIQAIEQYQKLFNLPKEIITELMNELKFQQTPLDGSIELLNKLQDYPISLFSITDNTKEIMQYHKTHSAFPKHFKDIIVSADIGVLKPDPKIYLHLLNKHDLKPSESLFIDDVILNVEGAIQVGMHGMQFIDCLSCEKQLIKMLSEDCKS